MVLLSALPSFQNCFDQMACGGLCLSKHTYLHAMLRKSTATMATWSLWVCGRYKKLFQACGTWYLIPTLVEELPKRLPTEMMVFFLPKTMTTWPCSSLSLRLNSWRLIKITSMCFHGVSTSTKTRNQFLHVVFPLALVLRMPRKMHDYMMPASLTFSRCMCCQLKT